MTIKYNIDLVFNAYNGVCVHVCVCALCVCACMCVLQGLFGVGKSTAKFMNKETNIKTKFM